jgi:hypothetical protein
MRTHTMPLAEARAAIGLLEQSAGAEPIHVTLVP